MELIFATGNAHKLTEVREYLKNLDLEVKSLKEIGFTEDIPEPFETIEENSAHKAKVIYEKYPVAILAEDTGLEVEVLGGRPGVYSARYAGEDRDPQANINKVLTELEGQDNRAARFKTVASLIIDGELKQFTGILSGNIIKNARGDNGFGYDPVFVPEGSQHTLAEYAKEDKVAISHRTQAIRQVLEYLNEL